MGPSPPNSSLSDPSRVWELLGDHVRVMRLSSKRELASGAGLGRAPCPCQHPAAHRFARGTPASSPDRGRAFGETLARGRQRLGLRIAPRRPMGLPRRDSSSRCAPLDKLIPSRVATSGTPSRRPNCTASATGAGTLVPSFARPPPISVSPPPLPARPSSRQAGSPAAVATSRCGPSHDGRRRWPEHRQRPPWHARAPSRSRPAGRTRALCQTAISRGRYAPGLPTASDVFTDS